MLKKKTYDDTFFLSLPGEMQKCHNYISEFIIKAERINDKRADNFRGVVEDIRRFQSSAIIYHVLMRDDVVICLNNVEMPPSFKVFMAKDPRVNGAKKVFIDATGIIEVKDNRYVCKNVVRLITYLFHAITWLLYEYKPEALLNNSNITLAATDCFVKLIDYVVGYFRFYGYNDNRTKVKYLAALYFMTNILSKDDDQYTNQVAAKLTGVDQSLTKAYKLYYSKEDLLNINTFVKMLNEVFKFKDLTLEAFLGTWFKNCGRGTQFALEMFAPFCNMIISTYTNANIVNQKSIDKQCGNSISKLCENILRLGSEELDRGKIFGESLEYDVVVRSGTVLSLQEAAKEKEANISEIRFTKEDCKSKETTKKKIMALIKHYTKSGQIDVLNKKIVIYTKTAIGTLSTTKNKEEYEIGVLTAILKPASVILKGQSVSELDRILANAANIQREYIAKYRVSDMSLAKVLSAQLDEIMKCKNMIKK